MSESIKEKLIQKILDSHEADQILIDILHVHLDELAYQELSKLNEERLLDIVLEY